MNTVFCEKVHAFLIFCIAPYSSSRFDSRPVGHLLLFVCVGKGRGPRKGCAARSPCRFAWGRFMFFSFFFREGSLAEIEIRGILNVVKKQT